jgi:hypothetical protein
VAVGDLCEGTAGTLDELEAAVCGRLRQIQRRPDLINAFLGRTGLTLEPHPWTLCFQPL